jgi:hypothetical protein
MADNYDIFYPADETVDHLAVAQALAVKIRDVAKQEDDLSAQQEDQVEAWTNELGTAIADAKAAYDTLRMTV